MTLYQVDAPHFCAGFVVENERVVRAADIIRSLKGWPAEKATRYCERKGWRVTFRLEGKVKWILAR